MGNRVLGTCLVSIGRARSSMSIAVKHSFGARVFFFG